MFWFLLPYPCFSPVGNLRLDVIRKQHFQTIMMSTPSEIQTLAFGLTFWLRPPKGLRAALNTSFLCCCKEKKWVCLGICTQKTLSFHNSQIAGVQWAKWVECCIYINIHLSEGRQNKILHTCMQCTGDKKIN